jgi:orotidine-5'-phosphate decarboxylase
VGATFPEQAKRLREQMPHTPFLVPGYGAQGATAEDVKLCFDAQGLGAIVNSSRGIVYAYQREPYASRFGENDFAGAARAAAQDMRDEINAALGLA